MSSPSTTGALTPGMVHVIFCCPLENSKDVRSTESTISVDELVSFPLKLYTQNKMSH